MKKAISVLLILSLCLFLLPMNDAVAAPASNYEEYAESLSTLGVFVGTGNGFALYREPTRAEGLVILIRLLGVEEEAMALKDSVLPFSDVPKWATGYVAYAYENELTKGISSTKFGSSDTLEAKAFITFLLRSLGYNDSEGDFTYMDAIPFAEGIGLVSNSMYTTLSTSTFLRAHTARIAYDTLKFPTKGTNILLIDRLIAENKIDINVGNAFKSKVLIEPSNSVFYDNYPGVPDFGKIVGCEFVRFLEDSYTYPVTDLEEIDLYNYLEALIDNGFEFLNGIEEEDNNVVMTYENTNLNKKVMTGFITYENIKYYLITITEIQ